MASKTWLQKKVNWSGKGDFAGDFADEEDTTPETLRDYEEPSPYAGEKSTDKTPFVKRKIDWSGGFGARKAEAKAEPESEPKKDAFTEELDKTPKGVMDDLGAPGEDEFTKSLGTKSKSTSRKSSGGRSSFARAFAKARLDAKAEGKDPSKSVFTWNGKKYNTKLA